MPSLEANQLLLAAADACDSKKAEDIRILALDPNESSLTDYFLICSGTNERQNAAIADEIELRLKREFGIYPNSVEGRRQGEWILMDYVDFVAHIFLPEKRAYYGLERLRKSAKTITVEELNDEVKTAVAALRSSGSKKSAAQGEDADETTPTRRGGKIARKSSSRVAEALASEAKTPKPAQGKKSSAAEAAGTKSSAGGKTAAKKVSAKKVSAKSSVKKAPAKKTAARKSANK